MMDSRTDPIAAQLRLQAELLRRLRRFFDDRGFLEVQTPLLSSEIIPEEHIEPFAVDWADRRFWLQSSPEAQMKRLLAALAAEQGATAPPLAIYQITRSFRAGESSPLHRPEFTLVEWYRAGDDMAAGIGLLDEVCRAAADAPPARRTSYREAFERFVGVEPHAATTAELQRALASHGISFAGNARDDLLNVLLVKLVEPNLGRVCPEILYDYPASQASLANVRAGDDGLKVAERFELYWEGIELANGFHELGNAMELRRRFEQVNAARTADGRTPLPLPERFLTAMQRGLPPCTGVALGFDRLLMATLGAGRLPVVPPLDDG
jgi:lysyl-tRNA synthetase class 2